MSSDPQLRFLVALRQGITQCFSISDISIMCADLDIDYESLGGEGKESKALELISYMNRRGRLTELTQYCVTSRPKHPWPSQTPINETQDKD
jgi:hypothetical protein